MGRNTHKETARKLANDLIVKNEVKLAKSMDCLENGLENSIAVLSLPSRYQKRLRTTNLAERVNEEIRRRQRVIRIFPNEDSAFRLIGAMLADINDKWHSQSHYFDMQEYWDWCQEENDKENNDITAENVVI